MSIVRTLSSPVIVAPMAGGPSTPALVDAAAAAGSLGFLAGGYLGAGELDGQMRSVHGGAYGVNLFCPQRAASSVELAAVRTYVEQLGPSLSRYGITPADLIGRLRTVDPTDAFAAKLEAVCAARAGGYGPAVVSCTFGVWNDAEVERLHGHGIEVWATVADVRAVPPAVSAGVDVIVVQGPGAGGHRATRTVEETPSDVPLEVLAGEVADVVDLPLVVAGGLGTPAEVAAALRWPGVCAVSCGSALLLADEAGTSQPHRDMVRGARECPDTAVTRAYSGRPARGVRTGFMTERTDAPAVYPYVNAVMGPVRSAAARSGDHDLVAAWVGTGVPHIRSGPAVDILRWLTGTGEA
ncbi:NAD(P)H-dependent flavin oxidoreductase [Corynebacterium pygosceleis]|uniref:NAD(P)H-dependent flavin oxidoreductase n=1 Tax=Corynebacterium pygosceleis TaxID=2800406 RepID=UPI002005171D|nr:nitronate monooxygenase [Corynebacterium pygosceleis]MCK7675799.1 nitronate monooxygenase [Corynebacterium pygosceleis]